MPAFQIIDDDEIDFEVMDEGPWDRIELNRSRLQGIGHWWQKNVTRRRKITFEKTDLAFKLVRDFQISQKHLRKMKRKFEYLDITGEGAIGMVCVP